MQEAPGYGARGSPPPADEGGDRSWRAGEHPPAPPDDPEQFVDRLGAGGTESGRCYVLRIALSAAGEEYALAVVEELRAEVDVVGTSLSLDVGPATPGVFDVLVTMDYDPRTVVRALVEPSKVDAVTVSRVDATGDDEAEDGFHADGSHSDGSHSDGFHADGATIGEAIADVDADRDHGGTTGGAERAPGKQATQGGPGERDTGVTAERDDTDSPGGDETFDRLKETTDRVSYDQLVAELDETSIPGEFRDDVNLGPLVEDEGADESEADTRAPAAAGGAPIENGDGGQQLEVPAGPDGALSAGQIVDALVTAVEEDALDDDQRRALANAFDTGPPKTLLVRLDHLQRELDELAAYKDSLEGFIDEYGAGEGLVQQVREVLERFTEDVAELEAAVAAVDDRVDEVAAVRSTVQDVEARLEDHRARLEGLASLEERVSSLETVEERITELEGIEEQVDRMDARVTTVERLGERVVDREATDERVREVDDAVGTLRDRLAAVESDLDTVRMATEADDGIEGRPDALDEEIPELSARVSALEAKRAGTVEDLADDVASIERRLADLESWQNRITSVLTTATSDDGGNEDEGIGDDEDGAEDADDPALWS